MASRNTIRTMPARVAPGARRKPNSATRGAPGRPVPAEQLSDNDMRTSAQRRRGVAISWDGPFGTNGGPACAGGATARNDQAPDCSRFSSWICPAW